VLGPVCTTFVELNVIYGSCSTLKKSLLFSFPSLGVPSSSPAYQKFPAQELLRSFSSGKEFSEVGTRLRRTARQHTKTQGTQGLIGW